MNDEQFIRKIQFKYLFYFRLTIVHHFDIQINYYVVTD